MVQPSLDDFMTLTEQGRPIVVTRDVLADMETPLSAYWKISQGETYSFLLESVTGGENLARYSMMGIRPRAVVRTKNQRVWIERDGQTEESELQPGQDPLHILESMMPLAPLGTKGLPKFCGGAVGMLGYDFVRFLEKLPDTTIDDLQVADIAMMLCDTVVVFDHAKNLIRILVLAPPSEQGYVDACAEIHNILEKLAQPRPALPGGKFPVHPVQSNRTQVEFEHDVEAMKAYITAGDGIQMVPAQRFETKLDAHPLSVYRALRSLNPSPYMYLLRLGDCDVVGASPEILVSLDKGTARSRPIAGTRWRGRTPEEDVALEVELLADEKERAEHIMLVDLARNDLGRVCDYGSVRVNELMVVERYSHVMHIVSDVTGHLRPDLTGFDLIRAGFPAGTVSGAPKVRAMQIIEELEPTRRGLYAGAVGYASATGDMDMAIAIRTIYITNGTAYVQAGGGVVYDSIAAKEYEESGNKARAALKAIELAQLGWDELSAG